MTAEIKRVINYLERKELEKKEEIFKAPHIRVVHIEPNPKLRKLPHREKKEKVNEKDFN